MTNIEEESREKKKNFSPFYSARQILRSISNEAGDTQGKDKSSVEVSPATSLDALTSISNVIMSQDIKSSTPSNTITQINQSAIIKTKLRPSELSKALFMTLQTQSQHKNTG